MPKIKKIYVWQNQVRPAEITETFNLTNWTPLIYKSWYQIKSVVIDTDYYNPSTWWAGATIKLGVDGTSKSIWYYIWGWQNNSYYPNSDGKIEGNAGSGTTKIYDLPYRYITSAGTYHIKTIFTREWITFQLWNNAEEPYLYSSGSWGATALSIMDDVNASIWWRAWSGGAIVSNGIGVVTYKPI